MLLRIFKHSLNPVDDLIKIPLRIQLGIQFTQVEYFSKFAPVA